MLQQWLGLEPIGARAESMESQSRPSGVRDRYNAFIEHHEIAWELAFGLVAIVFVALGFIIDEAPEGTRPGLEAIEIALTGLFLAEFSSRLLAAHDRARYLRSHWIDIVALAPPIRAARALRLLRLLRLIRAFAGIYRASIHLERMARHRGFAWLIVAWLGVMVICSIALYAAEHGLNKAIESPFDALWWGISTLSTVGYGDVYPVTPEGRLAAMVLMLLGIGLFSAITASVTSYLVSTGKPADASRGGLLADELERLAGLREQGSLTDDEFSRAKGHVLA
jgi:voltage-gated potassium channel